jgi:hypothetical protein
MVKRGSGVGEGWGALLKIEQDRSINAGGKILKHDRRQKKVLIEGISRIRKGGFMLSLEKLESRTNVPFFPLGSFGVRLSLV